MAVNEQDQAGDLLIQEVDEDLRREQYLKLWRAYGNYAIAAVVAIVLAVAGHQAWLSWQNKQFQKEAARFTAAEDLVTAGKQSEALAQLTAIAADKQAGFSAAAAFRQAELQTDAGNEAAAAVTYESLSHSDAPAVFRDLAVLKGAMLTLDSGDPEVLAKRLQPIATASNPWHFTAIELLALLANRRGDSAQAITYYKQLADDLATPQNIRSRATEMLALLGPAGKVEKE